MKWGLSSPAAPSSAATSRPPPSVRSGDGDPFLPPSARGLDPSARPPAFNLKGDLQPHEHQLSLGRPSPARLASGPRSASGRGLDSGRTGSGKTWTLGGRRSMVIAIILPAAYSSRRSGSASRRRAGSSAVEHSTFNRMVVSSILTRPTSSSSDRVQCRGKAACIRPFRSA